MHQHYNINVFSIICLCIVYFTCAVCKCFLVEFYSSVFFINIIRLMFFYVVLCVILLFLRWISYFSFTSSLLILYAYVSIKLIFVILLSSFKLKGIFLISSVKTCLSLLNHCFVFDINLLFFFYSLWCFLKRNKSIFQI